MECKNKVNKKIDTIVKAAKAAASFAAACDQCPLFYSGKE